MKRGIQLRRPVAAMVYFAAAASGVVAADSNFPSRTYPFTADFGDGFTGKFSNVSGIQRHAPETAPADVGAARVPVVLIRGFVDEKTGTFLAQWLAAPRGSQRRTVSVTMNDAAGRQQRTWTVPGAYIARMSSDESESGEGRKVDTLILKRD